jgi:hypothetical protein
MLSFLTISRIHILTKTLKNYFHIYIFIKILRMCEILIFENSI